MTPGAHRQAPQDPPSAPSGQLVSESSAAALMVELVIQYPEAAAPEATSPEVTNPETTSPEAANPEEAAQPVRYALVRTLHRVPPGTTIRQLLQRAAAASALQTPLVPGTSPAAQHPTPRVDDASLERACPGGDEPCNLVQAIEAKALGLSRFGRRAWLDDPLRPDDRVEVLRPILADAKAARFARVAKSRAERTDGRWGRRSVADRQIRATKRQPEG